MITTHRIKKAAAVVVGIFGIQFVASATDYTWVGGTTGDWNNLENWKVGDEAATAVPKGGDTATFNSSSHITISGSEIQIGEGILTNYCSVLGKTVTFTNVVISGNGGLAKGGLGNLTLSGNNTFKGGLTIINTDTRVDGKPKQNYNSLFGPNAAGTGKIKMEVHLATRDQDYSTLRLYAPAGGMTVENDIDPGWAEQNRAAFMLYGDNITFNGEVGAVRMCIEGDNKSHQYYFYGKIGSSNNYFDFRNGTFHVYNKDSVFTTYVPRSDAIVHYYAKTKVTHFWGESVNEFHAEEVFPSVTDFQFKGSVSFKLNGFNQTISPSTYYSSSSADYNCAGYFDKSTNKNVIDSPVGSPANMKFSQAYAKNEYYAGKLTGAAGITWNGHASSKFRLDMGTSDTCGYLKVLKGEMITTNNTTFTRLRGIEVSAGAKFTVDESAGDIYAVNVTVETDGDLAIGDNRTITCAYATIHGQELEPGDDYYFGFGKLVVEGFKRNTWVGASGGKWSDADNWYTGVPAAGDVVTLGNVTIDVDSTLAVVPKSVEVGSGATLNFSSWNAVLRGETIHIANGGKLSIVDAFTNDNQKCRVQIACKDLTIDQGGAIDLVGKGWHGGWKDHAVGYGPGCLASFHGAGHGGVASYEWWNYNSGINLNNLTNYSLVYDDPYAPIEPGSGGGGWCDYDEKPSAAWDNIGGGGGGAVFIEATGVVTVNGNIQADADVTNAEGYHNDRGGSGGSVWIKAKYLTGNGGVISAKGGDSNVCQCQPWYWDSTGNKNYYGMTGGGGMIRIEYTDATAQAAAVLANFTISAAAGNYIGWSGAGEAYKLTVATRDKYRAEADLGTITFGGGTAILDKMLGKGLSGRIMGLTDSTYTYSENLEWTSGHVRFADEGANVTFEKALTIKNDSSRLEIGGIYTPTCETVMVEVYAGKKLNQLLVKGDFTLTDGAAFDIRAAETNKTNKLDWGGEVKVNGDFTIGANAIVHPWCDMRNLGAPHFIVLGDFSLASTALIDADRRGGGAGWSTSNMNKYMRVNRGSTTIGHHDAGFGIGGTAVATAHGGRGGRYVVADYVGLTNIITATTYQGKVLGDEWTAAYPGAGTYSGGYTDGADGGGLVYIECAGDMTIDGEITADGYGIINYAACQHCYSKGGGAAGGSIRLIGKTVSVGATAKLSAEGGPGLVNYYATDKDGNKNRVYAQAGGGGGRILIGNGGDLLLGGGKYNFSHLADVTAVPSGVSVADGADFSVEGGKLKFEFTTSRAAPLEYWPGLLDAAQGEAGTVRYVSYLPKPGCVIIYR